MADRVFPVPERYGLVETCAAKHMARYGRWPADFEQMIKLHCHGVVPARVTSLAERLRQEQPWAVSEREHNPHPGWTRVHFGPHSFLVPTATLLGKEEYDPDAPTP